MYYQCLSVYKVQIWGEIPDLEPFLFLQGIIFGVFRFLPLMLSDLVVMHEYREQAHILCVQVEVFMFCFWRKVVNIWTVGIDVSLPFPSPSSIKVLLDEVPCVLTLPRVVDIQNVYKFETDIYCLKQGLTWYHILFHHHKGLFRLFWASQNQNKWLTLGIVIKQGGQISTNLK